MSLFITSLLNFTTNNSQCPFIPTLPKNGITVTKHYSLNVIGLSSSPTLYISRKALQHLLATGVSSCEEPGSAHEQNDKISREELPHPIKQRRDEQWKTNFFVSLPLWWSLLILVDSCAEWGWPNTLRIIQGAPQCLCHAPRESSGHMLLTCFLYTQERLTLVSKVEKLLPKFNSFKEKRKLEVWLFGLYPDNPDFYQIN